MAKGLDLFMHRLRTLVDPARLETATDGQLLSRWALNRDGRAFTALVGRHGPMVWRVGRSILAQREDAEDVFQATFLVLARKAATLQRRSSIGGWLYQTAYRLAYKSRAATARRLRREDRAAQKAVGDPLEEISVREARTILAQELDRLSTVYREPLLLCLYEGATQDEAARRLGCPIRTLKRRLERGRALLGRRLSRRGLAPSGALALTLCSRAEVPAGLVAKTIAAATQFVSGQMISGTAAVLAEGVLRGLMLKKLAAYVTLLLALGSLTLAAGFAFAPTTATRVAKAPRIAEPEAPAKTKVSVVSDVGLERAPRLDPNGDPLPPGAIQRIGSSRFRHGGQVTELLYTPDGKAIASTSTNGYLNLWDAASGTLRWRIAIDKNVAPRPLGQLAVSSDGKRLALLDGVEYAEVERDTGKKLFRHEWPKTKFKDDDSIRCLAIAPELGMYACGCTDCTVRLYDAVSGQEKFRVVAGEKAQRQSMSIKFSADAKTIYVRLEMPLGPFPLPNGNGRVSLFDTKLALFDTNTGKPVPLAGTGKDFYPTHQFLSPNNHMLAQVNLKGPITLWNLRDGKQLRLEAAQPTGGAFSPDGSLFAISDANTIVLFDTTSGKERIRLRGNESTLRQGLNWLVFAPDGRTLAVGDKGGCITLWSVVTGEPVPPFTEPIDLEYIQFANEGNQVICVGNNVEWWDVASGKPIRHLSRDLHFYKPSISPDGRLLAATSRNGEVVLTNATTGGHLRTLSGTKPKNSGSNLFFHVSTLFSPDSTKLYSGNDSESRVIIWDVKTGTALHELQWAPSWLNNNMALAVSPDSQWLASWGIKGELSLWEVATGKLTHRVTTPRGAPNFPLVFSADSRQLASVGRDHKVRLWDVVTGKELRVLSEHQAAIKSVALSPDGRMAVTGSLDKTLRLWEIATGQERGQITGHEEPVISLHFSPNGRVLAAASSDAPVYVWDVYATQKSKFRGTKLTDEAQEKLWQSLADTDAAVGFQAMCELIARPSEAAAILEDGWQRLSRATPEQMHKWVEDLSSDQFAIRKTATQELERFAAAHDDLLREALQQVGSLEARQRLEQLLGRLDPERLRRSRMLEVLEQLRTPEARQFLKALAQQQEDTAMAREAAAGLKRLEQLK